uniref:Uncharacterized protein n=1 Tax=Physcomitrium patens TaxID=3218 RepID=A0A2K1JT73_PHYPA|nr:hypothetical protein PHYPA_014503 [Physcomitrium patens]
MSPWSGVQRCPRLSMQRIGPSPQILPISVSFSPIVCPCRSRIRSQIVTVKSGPEGGAPLYPCTPPAVQCRSPLDAASEERSSENGTFLFTPSM